MASDVEKTLYSILKTTEFSLQIDESTLPGNEALLLAYVRFIHKVIMVEEMLFDRPLVTDTKGESIYKSRGKFLSRKGNSHVYYHCLCRRWGACYGR